MTILPPPPDMRERDTEPPDNPRESSAPPADLGPTGIALRLLALEEQVGEIHAETKGISKAIHDIKNGLIRLCDAYDRIATELEVLRQDAISQRLSHARVSKDVDELRHRGIGQEEE